MLVTKECPGCGSAIGSERFCSSCSSAIPQFHEDFSAPAAETAGAKTVEAEGAPGADGAASPMLCVQPASESETETVADGCQSCRATPTAEVTLRQETGKVFWRTRRLIEGRFCRDCGISLFREMQNRTLITGWWGLISFFVNWATVARNIVAANRLQRLLAPTSEPGEALSARLNPGKPLFQRGGVWVAAVVMVVLGAIVASEGSSRSSTGYGDPSGYTPPPTSYRAPNSYRAPGDAGNWSYSQESEVRAATTRAGFSWSEATCLVNYLSSRYSYSQLSEAAVINAASFCD